MTGRSVYGRISYSKRTFSYVSDILTRGVFFPYRYEFSNFSFPFVHFGPSVFVVTHRVYGPIAALVRFANHVRVMHVSFVFPARRGNVSLEVLTVRIINARSGLRDFPETIRSLSGSRPRAVGRRELFRPYAFQSRGTAAASAGLGNDRFRAS